MATQPSINASGFLGIGREVTYGTYVAPTKFIPVRSETLETNQELIDRRVIRNLAGLVGVVKGNMHVEGEIEFEVTSDILPYFLLAGRTKFVKTGALSPFTYVATPEHGAMPKPGRSLSITVVRNGEVFGFTGCIVGGFNFSMDNGMLICSCSVVGVNESSQALPVPVWDAGNPYGPGMYNVEIPTATPTGQFDSVGLDSWSLEINDNATPEFRMRGDHGAEFARYGERTVSMSLQRDFLDRAEFDAFKAMTKQSITIEATGLVPAEDAVTFLLPSNYKASYGLGLASQGDLTMADIEYTITHDEATGTPEYTITVLSTEEITGTFDT